MEIYELIHNQLCNDDAVVGEAAGVAIGLLMVGSNNPDVLEEMINYARDTHHEKIIRGLSLGIALILYGQLDNPEATKTIDELSKDKEPLLLNGTMHMTRMRLRRWTRTRRKRRTKLSRKRRR